MHRTFIPLALLVAGFAISPPVSGAEAPKGKGSVPPAMKPESDAGAKDPADFPRPAGLVRRSYSQTPGAMRLEEVATYHAKTEFDATVTLYRDLAAAGWKQQAQSPSGTGLNRVQIIDWNKPAKEAE